MVESVFNFAAGPAALPKEVINRFKQGVVRFDNSQVSILELGHRSSDFYEMRDALKDLLRDVLNIPEGYDILFSQGGARHQFAMLPFNFVDAQYPGAYILSGHWGKRALVECQQGDFAHEVLFDDSSSGFTKGPSQLLESAQKDFAYIHFTSNETIHGVQLKPKVADYLNDDLRHNPIVIDLSSDIMSREINVKNYDLIYACAQKNCGIAGNTITIANKSFSEGCHTNLPPVWNYKNLFASDSVYNTAPVASIYATYLMVAWLKERFGDLAQVESYNTNKAQLIYEVIDDSDGFYTCHAQREFRSMTNIVFVLKSDELTEKFLREAEAKGMIGLKGHRVLGGVRVSNYNAIELDWMKKLAGFMTDFMAS